MKILINSVAALNPHILRVSLQTYLPEDLDKVSNRYELAIPIDSFINRIVVDSVENVEVNLQLFQEVVTNRVIEAQNVANVATAIDVLDLEWEVVLTDQLVETSIEKDGKILAYGETENENT